MKDKYVHAAISMNWKSYSMDGDLSNHLLTSDHVSAIPLIGTWQLTMFPFLWPSCKLYCRFALKLCVCLPQLAIFLQEWKGKPWNIIKNENKNTLSTFWLTKIPLKLVANFRDMVNECPGFLFEGSTQSWRWYWLLIIQTTMGFSRSAISTVASWC